MAKTNPKASARHRRKKHIRKIVRGTAARPRLTVFRSSRHIYAQLIAPAGDRVLAAASTLDKDLRGAGSGNADAAAKVGALIADRAKQAGVTRVAFDRSGYKYHGRVKALADAAREGGLEF